jgi:hypothetical protein
MWQSMSTPTKCHSSRCISDASVCSQDFPLRRLHGQHVNTHEQLIAYLCAKHPRVATHQLPFGGRNTVVFLKPPQVVGGHEQKHTAAGGVQIVFKGWKLGGSTGSTCLCKCNL